jgi:predicted proteasome-type protease
MANNILKLGAVALSHVPTPKAGVSADAYARDLHDWHRNTGSLKVYAAAGNLAIECALLTEATDEESRKFLAHLTANVSKLPTDVISGEPRVQRNERQARIMRERRAKAKAERTANANTDSRS